MSITRLVITEKERMALNIARALGGYSRHPLGSTPTRWRRRGTINVYEVAGAGGGEGEGHPTLILPLRGHVMNYVTRRELERWTHDSVDRILNDSRSLVKVASARGYHSAIRSLADKSSEVVIATDSDEEGENIGLEVMEILGGYPRPIRRLWLNTTIPEDIRKAFSSLRQFNRDLALSVEARRKIDAITGFAGTRELTLSLRPSVLDGGKGVLSFGRVQTSTLWIVAGRERNIQAFASKPYWEIAADVDDTRFVHSASPFFEKERALQVYERVKGGEELLCTDVREEAESAQPPRPMNTAELLRTGSNLLRISPIRVLSLAEELYLEGKISYPRVDNQTYAPSFDHRSNIAKLAAGTKFGEYADSLRERGLTAPTRGRFSEDHEPITPIAAIKEFRDPLGYRLYELVLRHYLSIFGPPARVVNLVIKGTVRGEPFQADGRRVIDSGFYAIYYFPPRERPIGESFKPSSTNKVRSVDLVEKKTAPSPRYTEASLLAEMEKQGIGTKSTRPLMTETLKRRGYVRVQGHVVFPTDRGMKFIASIEKPWGEYVSPRFTARVESDMEKVARGQRRWDDLVDSERESFARAIGVFRAQRRSKRARASETSLRPSP